MAPTATSDPHPTTALADERWVLCPSTEHLLIAILGDIEVVAALRACRASEGVLGDALRARIAARETRGSRVGAAMSSWWRGREARPDPGVERVLARSLIRAQSTGRQRVTSAQVLLSLLDEPDCVAADLLRAQGVTRYDALNHVSHRIAKGSQPVFPPKPASPWILCGVILHNDDYTPMEFVVHVLETVFDKSREDAVRSMMRVHEQGSAVCGVFAYDAALAKVAAVTDLGRSREFALRCVLEIKTTEREGAHAELLT